MTLVTICNLHGIVGTNLTRFLKYIFTCSRENKTLVAITNWHKIVCNNLTTEFSVCQREEKLKFCLHPGVVINTRSARPSFALLIVNCRAITVSEYLNYNIQIKYQIKYTCNCEVILVLCWIYISAKSKICRVPHMDTTNSIISKLTM